ncbi:DUF6119 family protein [Kitasatospora sp. NPDC005856]|uniref:DUF6119 family protein n=1 Tax=Kitasatospora sp. NPDC005856 TaxID=3154566 RepID=UPI0033FF4A15
MHEQLSLLATPTEIAEPTLYLLQGVGSSSRALRRALRRSSEQGKEFQVRDITVDGIPCVSAYGYLGATGKPPWLGALSRLVDEPVELTSRRAGAVILLSVAGRVFAVCFGFGHLLLETESIAPSFGMDYVRRTADPDTLKELTHTRMDPRVYTDRTSTARGRHAREFELDEYGEICSRMVATARGTGLTAERALKPGAGLRVAGGPSLKVPLAVDATHLVSDLRAIAATLDQEPNPGLDVLSRIDGLPETDPLVRDLDQRLAEALGEPESSGRVAFAWPTTLLDHLPEFSALRVHPTGNSQCFLTDEVTAEAFREQLDRLPAEKRLAALRKARIHVVSDPAGEVTVGSTSALRWVAAEISLDSGRYLRQENKWRRIGADHQEFIDTELRELFTASPDHGFPAWPTKSEAGVEGLKDAHEAGYNELVARKLGWYVLDKNMIRCELHPVRGFEAADLVAPDGTLVHVKRAGESGPLSHLAVQGRISADALHTAVDANRAFVEAVRAKSPDFPDGHFTPRRVVFAIALKTGAALTPESLFTVSKISLLQTARALRRLGIEVHIQPIDYRARADQDRLDKQQAKQNAAQTPLTPAAP